ncbi:MSP domain protein [Cooperia oncophora]
MIFLLNVECQLPRMPLWISHRQIPTQEDFTRFHSVKEHTLTSTSMVLANTPFFPWQGVSRATQDSPIPDDTQRPSSNSTQISTATSTDETVKMRQAYGDWHDLDSTAKLSQTRSLPTIDTRTVKSTVSISSICEPAPSGADLVTNPMFTLDFPRFGHKRWKRVTVSNVSQKNIIWSLRTNMCDYLTARPTAGVLKPGQHDSVKVSITDMCDVNGKVAFSYGFVDDSVEAFERKLYQDTKQSSHTLDVLLH